jgi:hypothetical protein
MPTITIPRSDLTSQEVADALRHGLAPKYHVLPGTAVNWNPVGHPRPDHADTIVVGTGSDRFFRAQVKISRAASGTMLHVSPGGLSLGPRLMNRLGIVRTVLRVLHDAPSLR